MPEGSAIKAGSFKISRKHLNENIGLILTAIASIAAALAWNEARLTRKDAREEAEKAIGIQQETFKAQLSQFTESITSQQQADAEHRLESARTYGLQKNSLDAQIQSMQLDQRPFLRTNGELIESSDDLGRLVYQLRVGLEVSGKTPAINVHYSQDSAEIDSSKLSDAVVHRLMSKAKSLLESTPLLYPSDGELFPWNYQFARDAYVVVFGYVRYEDVFHAQHRTEFCYYSDNSLEFIKREPGQPLRPMSCPGFVPKIT